jgi:hypothetical protein
MVYRGTKFAGERASRSTLHEIAKPLARVISLLEHEPNRDGVLVALGAPEWLAIRGRFSMDPTEKLIPGGDLGEQQAAVRRRSLLDDLRAIARAVPEPPAPRKRGRPPTAKSFHDFVDRLATCWERASGTTFRSVNRSKQFVINVIEFVDPRVMLEVDVRERLTLVIADDEAGVRLLDGPGRREAAGGHPQAQISTHSSRKKLANNHATPGDPGRVQRTAA